MLEPIRLIIIDDHEVVREGLSALMEDEPDMRVVGQAGASGYVLKGAPSEELFGAIRVVHQGGVYLPPKLTGRLVQDYLSHQTPLLSFDDPLTPRESEVLILIAQGATNRDIAQRLTLSLNTVKTHRLRIYQKLNLRDRASLVNYALRRGLLFTASSSY